MTHTQNKRVSGYTLTTILGYRKRTEFQGRITAMGDIMAKFPDGRVIYVNMQEVKLRKTA